MLFSAIHDLGQRNPLSEALQRRLDQRHALALQRWARLREIDALRAAWQQALADGDVAAALWALLTHRQGAELQRDALFEARAWLLESGRRGVAQAAQDLAMRSALDAARGQVADLQLRLQRQQAHSAAALDALRRESAAALGAATRWRAEPRQAAARPAPAPRALREARPPAAPTPAMPMPAAPPPAQPLDVQGRQVLCQAGCINHEAYQRIKHFCARSGKPCVYLPRPSLSHFERALQQLASTMIVPAPHAPATAGRAP